MRRMGIAKKGIEENTRDKDGICRIADNEQKEKDRTEQHVNDKDMNENRIERDVGQ